MISELVEKMRGALAVVLALSAHRAEAALFTVTSGTCTISTSVDGLPCVQSPNYPLLYSTIGCSISIGEIATITAVSFSTELCCDKLELDGIEYSGTRGPIGIDVAPGSDMTWDPDYSVSDNGWEICQCHNCSLANDDDGDDGGGDSNTMVLIIILAVLCLPVVGIIGAVLVYGCSSKPSQQHAARQSSIQMTSMRGGGAEMITITVPPNCGPGTVLSVSTRSGAPVEVTVPAGVVPGQQISVAVGGAGTQPPAVNEPEILEAQVVLVTPDNVAMGAVVEEEDAVAVPVAVARASVVL